MSCTRRFGQEAKKVFGASALPVQRRTQIQVWILQSDWESWEEIYRPAAPRASSELQSSGQLENIKVSVGR